MRAHDAWLRDSAVADATGHASVGLLMHAMAPSGSLRVLSDGDTAMLFAYRWGAPAIPDAMFVDPDPSAAPRA